MPVPPPPPPQSPAFTVAAEVHRDQGTRKTSDVSSKSSKKRQDSLHKQDLCLHLHLLARQHHLACLEISQGQGQGQIGGTDQSHLGGTDQNHLGDTYLNHLEDTDRLAPDKGIIRGPQCFPCQKKVGYQRRSMYLLVECRDMLKQILQNYPGASLVHNEPTLELEQQGNLEDFQNFDISLNDKREFDLCETGHDDGSQEIEQESDNKYLYSATADTEEQWLLSMLEHSGFLEPLKKAFKCAESSLYPGRHNPVTRHASPEKLLGIRAYFMGRPVSPLITTFYHARTCKRLQTTRVMPDYIAIRPSEISKLLDMSEDQTRKILNHPGCTRGQVRLQTRNKKCYKVFKEKEIENEFPPLGI
ncbi:unnamed protein product [Mytilus edulis]|uniref:Uncharacterized protein n=1 Tax=Mytilus edulis TaxID=6550 RepID=A0A8S3RBH2_MYTED|nr:unnamed protein product [Mytilus edulis]